MAGEGQLNVSLESDINLSLCNIKSSPLSHQDPMGANLKIHHPHECDHSHYKEISSIMVRDTRLQISTDFPMSLS